MDVSNAINMSLWVDVAHNSVMTGQMGISTEWGIPWKFNICEIIYTQPKTIRMDGLQIDCVSIVGAGVLLQKLCHPGWSAFDPCKSSRINSCVVACSCSVPFRFQFIDYHPHEHIGFRSCSPAVIGQPTHSSGEVLPQ